MRRSGETPLDDTTRSRFSKLTSIDERKRQKRLRRNVLFSSLIVVCYSGDHSSSGSKADAFVGSEDEDDKTNDGYFAGLIMNMFQRQLQSKIKVPSFFVLLIHIFACSSPNSSQLQWTSTPLCKTSKFEQNVRNQSRPTPSYCVIEVTATLEAEERAAKEEEEKAKATLTNVHESVLQAINSMHDSIPLQNADSPSP